MYENSKTNSHPTDFNYSAPKLSGRIDDRMLFFFITIKWNKSFADRQIKLLQVNKCSSNVRLTIL